MTAEQLRVRLGVPELVLRESVGSTMDVAHDRATAGALAGTVVLADAQKRGRGRGGAVWLSEPGAGIWLSLVERPSRADQVGVMSVRLGAHAAKALDEFAPERVRLKWPNDLFTEEGKLAGILIETRWRRDRPEWVAIGVGINVRRSDVAGAGALRDGVARLAVLAALLPALRRAATVEQGTLAPDELAEWRERDLAVGRRIVAPAAGEVVGVSPDGALLVRTAEGVARYTSGSLVLAEGA